MFPGERTLCHEVVDLDWKEMRCAHVEALLLDPFALFFAVLAGLCAAAAMPSPTIFLKPKTSGVGRRRAVDLRQNNRSLLQRQSLTARIANRASRRCAQHRDIEIAHLRYAAFARSGAFDTRTLGGDLMTPQTSKAIPSPIPMSG